VSAPESSAPTPARSNEPSRVGIQADEGAGLRDAQTIAARIAADEAAADAAREQYAASGVPAIEPDAGYASVARSGESLHAVRRNAILEPGRTDDNEPVLRGGTLYLTSSRLLHVGVETTNIPLREIDEMVVALKRLVLIRLQDGSHFAVEVDQPRLLRVQIAAAIAAARAAAGSSAAGSSAAGSS